MKKNLIKVVLILVVVLGALNIKWLYQPSTDTHFSIAQSIDTDIAEKQFLTLSSAKDTCNYYINHKFTTTCDVVTNYDDIVVVEYKGNDYKVLVKDGDNYNNVSRADVTFKAGKSLKDYKIVNIKPIEVN